MALRHNLPIWGTCPDCGDQLVTEKVWRNLHRSTRLLLRRHGFNVYGGRGLCARDYQYRTDHGTLIDVERFTHSFDEVLDAWRNDDHQPGESMQSRIRRLAPRLDMKVNALDKTIQRLRARGDL
jgi:hypothetical protein